MEAKSTIIIQDRTSSDILHIIQGAFIWSSHSWNGRMPYKPNLLPLKKFIESLGGKLLLQATLPDGRIKTYSFDNPLALRRNPDFRESEAPGNVLMYICAHLSDSHHSTNETTTFFEEQTKTLQFLKQFAESFGGKITLLIEKPTGVMTGVRL